MNSEEKSKNKSLPDSNSQNIQPILNKLSNDFSYQKSYIKLLNEVIKNVISGNEEEKSNLEKINNMLPTLIQNLGLPFCYLMNNNQDIINYYCNIYLEKDKNSEIAEKILMNFINVFNYESVEVNPSDDLIEILEDCDPDTFKEIKNNKRITKNEIETIYDGLSDLFSIWRMSINIIENLENDRFDQYHYSLNEITNKINEIEKIKKYPKATIEFLREKIKDCESPLINKKKFNTFEKKKNNDLSGSEDINDKKKYFSNPLNANISNFNQFNNQNITNFNINNNNNNIINESDIEENLKVIREIPLKNRTSFYKDELLVDGEDDMTEFKNYIFPLNEKQVDELKRQFCGFLNSKGGRLYLGINDEKIVKGVVLNYKKCDALRNLLVNFTYEFYPKCRLDKIKVFFIPIRSMKDNKFINNLYIVKIIVLPGEPYILYSMTNKGFNAAIRLQGQCANLTAEEIYGEIIKRGNLPKNYDFVNINKNFNDPEPEKNLDVEKEMDDDDWIINDQKKNKNSENLEKPKKKKKKKNKKDVFVVEVKNIDINMNTKDIYNIFNGCGCIEQKFFDKQGKSRGYGILKFSNETLAQSTIDKFNQNKIGENNIILLLKNNNN